MAYTGVILPLTGSGDVNATPAVDLIGGRVWQGVKLFDATEGSTVPIIAKTVTPDAADPGLVIRVAPSTAQLGSVTVLNPTSAVDAAATLTSAGSTRLVGRVTVENPTTSVSLSSQHTITVGNPTTAVNANLTSDGSTKLVGRVTVENPTTSVSLSSQHTVTVGNPTSAVSLSSVHTFTVGNPTTAVEANLSSVGSTKLVGQVTVNNPTTAVSLSSVHTITVGNPTTSVTVTSGVVLGAGSSANILGTVALTGGSTNNTIGSVALVAGSSANVIGAAVQGPGSSANFWYTQPLAFSSGNAARSTVNTSVDVSIIGANAARKALVIANLSTAQIVAIGMTTAAVTTALGGVSIYLPPNSQLTFGYSGGMPLFTGPFRGINISSTVIAGGVAVTEFT